MAIARALWHILPIVPLPLSSASLPFLCLPAFPRWRYPKIPSFKSLFSKSGPLYYRCLFHIKSSLGPFSLRVPPEWGMMFNCRPIITLQSLSPLLTPSIIYWNQVAPCESKGTFFFSVCLEMQSSSRGDADKWRAGQAWLNPSTEGGEGGNTVTDFQGSTTLLSSTSRARFGLNK